MINENDNKNDCHWRFGLRSTERDGSGLLAQRGGLSAGPRRSCPQLLQAAAIRNWRFSPRAITASSTPDRPTPAAPLTAALRLLRRRPRGREGQDSGVTPVLLVLLVLHAVWLALPHLVLLLPFFTRVLARLLGLLLGHFLLAEFHHRLGETETVHLVQQRVGSLARGASLREHAEKILKELIGGTGVVPSLARRGTNTPEIVIRASALVAENFVCEGDFLEASFRHFPVPWILVGMPAQRRLAVGVPDLLIRGVAGDAEDLVVRLAWRHVPA